MQTSQSISRLCGNLIVGGFEGAVLSESYRRELAEGRRAGVILFRRNLPDLNATAALVQSIVTAAESSLFIGVDQEGGRVTRMPKEFLVLPPARILGQMRDLSLVRRAAKAVATELSCIGINLNFAPVLDVDSNPDNPVIGDRAFGNDPRIVMRTGIAFLQGLQEGNVLACGKHFPGHGDTISDSHVSLPRLMHGRERMEQIELPPFRAAVGAGLSSLMTAHVVYENIEPNVPATFSRSICASLLRAELGFGGVLFSDDLEMNAIALHWAIEDATIEAIWAGCDVLLICRSEELQSRAHAALVKRAESDSKFRQRCEEAAARSLRLRRICPPRPIGSLSTIQEIIGGEISRNIAIEIERAQKCLLEMGQL